MSKEMFELLESLNNDIFSEAEYVDMNKAADDNELYAIGVILFNKISKELNFTEEQVKIWKDKIISGLAESHLAKINYTSHESFKQAINAVYTVIVMQIENTPPPPEDLPVEPEK